MYKSVFEKRKIDLLKNIIKPGMTVLDIGAYIGYYTVLFSRLVGNEGKVYAFEPDELNFSYLKRNTGRYKNVMINKLAVGENSGEALLYHSDVLSVDLQTYDSGENRRTSKGRRIAIDDYFTDEKKPDFIKIDVQGYDYFAVKGMMRTLEKSDAVVILGEFWPYGLKKAGVEPGAYIELLENIGFEIKFEGKSKREELFKKSDDYLCFTDFFAFKKKSRASV